MWQWLGYGWAAGSSLVVIPLLTLLTLPVLVAAGRREHRFDLAGLAATGLGLHFFAAFYRMAHGADAFVYDQQGDRIAEAFRHFRFNVDPGAPVPGTGAMRIISGVVSVFTGANVAAKFLVFAWLGFIGCYLLYRAFVTALPNADHRRYALLIFLWPSLAFWPSSIGKDCWMLLTLGIASVGAARVLVRRPGGYTLLVLGLLLGSFVRPHVSLMALLAFGVALLVSRRESSRPGVTPSSIAKVAGLLVLIVLGGILASRAATVLDVDDFSSSSVNSVARDQPAAPRRAVPPSVPPIRRTHWAMWKPASRSCSDRSRPSRAAPSRSRPRSRPCSCSCSARRRGDGSCRCSDGCGRSRT